MSPASWRAAFIERVVSSPGSLPRLQAALEAEGLAPLPPVGCPAVWSREERATVIEAVEAWHRAMTEVLRRWAVAPGSLAVPLPAPWLERARREAADGVALGFTRYDFVFDRASGRVVLLECQAGDPSGIGMEDGTANALRVLGPLDGLSRAAVVDSHQRLIAPEPTRAGLVVFAIQRAAYVNYDQRRVARAFRDRGVDAVVADPDELRFDGEALWLDGRRISLIVRDSLEDLLLPVNAEGSAALFAAWAADAVEVWNPVGAAVADLKALLGRVRDPEVLAAVGPGTAATLEKTVPVTLALQDADVASLRREAWVLKPSDGYGGFDVTVGPAVTDAQWRSALEAAAGSARPWVLQSYAAAAREPYPMGRDGAWAVESLNVVYSAWIHGGRFGGLFARVHPHAVVNVHQGGGLVPVYTLE